MEVEPPLEAGTIYGTYRPALHQHIVSVVPSQTELLHYLGLDSQIAGITRFCTQPPHWHKTKTRIGGTKDINLHKVQQLKPTLLLANEEENTREQVLAIAEYCPVYVSKVHNLDTALGMMVDVGRLTQTDLRACQLAHDIRAAFNSLPLVAPPLRVAYLIWKEPYMAAGGHTFINDMLQWAGFENVFAHLSRYPVVQPGDWQALHADLVLLSSEPYPFGTKHLQLPEFQSSAILVDGSYFSWYGSRLLRAPAYFKQLGIQVQRLMSSIG